MKYFLVVGEASGDLHASRLMQQLQLLDSAASFVYMGGEKMREIGGSCIVHSEDLAFMGFLDVAKNFKRIHRAAKKVQERLLETVPDVVICVDYAGFSFQYILPFVRKQLPRTKIVYYIPPKVWAWKKGRIPVLKESTDLVLSIFPFEVPFFRRHHVSQVHYVGNPSYESVELFLRSESGSSVKQPVVSPKVTEPYVALVPGSRLSEIRRNLPLMLSVVKQLGLQAIITGAPSIPIDFYNGFTKDDPSIEVCLKNTYPVIHAARTALVTSGTATLETALLGTPQVVCYSVRGGSVANFVYRHFFSVPYISLVNLIADAPIVPELFGGLFTKENISLHLSLLHKEGATDTGKEFSREKMIDGYHRVRELLYTEEEASLRSAKLILQLFQ